MSLKINKLPTDISVQGNTSNQGDLFIDKDTEIEGTGMVFCQTERPMV